MLTWALVARSKAREMATTPVSIAVWSEADSAAGFLFRVGQRGEEHSREDRDDADDDEEFNERESDLF